MSAIMSNHPFQEGSEQAKQYSECIASGSGWVYESVWFDCKRCKRRFWEVVTVYGYDRPAVCPDCEMQLRTDSCPDPLVVSSAVDQ